MPDEPCLAVRFGEPYDDDTHILCWEPKGHDGEHRNHRYEWAQWSTDA